MITLETADNALKSFYLDAITDSLDKKVNPFLAQIEKTAIDVVGKDVKKLIRCGMEGGLSAGTETGALPTSSSAKKVVFTSTLKNLYGTIEISDKALRASANNEGAFVNILNEEMQSLVKSANFNFGRMLYGDGTGLLAYVMNGEGKRFQVGRLESLVEGMVVDVIDDRDGKYLGTATIERVDKDTDYIYLDKEIEVVGEEALYLQGALGNEITGLAAIFSENNIYGVSRGNNPALKPYTLDVDGDLTEEILEKAMDTIEEKSGSKVNVMLCSFDVRRVLTKLYKDSALLTVETLEGGYKVPCINGIPVIADRFCPNQTLYLLNTNDFKIHQLCDWKWLEGEDGKILKQVPGKPVYTATLVKYAELMCERLNGQGVLKGIRVI